VGTVHDRARGAHPVTHQDNERDHVSSAPSAPSRVEGSVPPPSAGGTTATGTSTVLDPKVAGLLAYLSGWVTGLISFLRVLLSTRGSDLDHVRLPVLGARAGRWAAT
jgi:hypothetical protein